MSYHRVIPRDLFNEANLLKCYGQFYLELEKMPHLEEVELRHFAEDKHFQVYQDQADGSLAIANVYLAVRRHAHHLSRPLNSREPWPFYLTTHKDEVIAVFDDQGHFTAEMIAYLEEAP